MPLRRERIPVAAPIKGHGSSWLTQYGEIKGAVRMRNYSDKTLEAYRYWIGKVQAFVRSKPRIISTRKMSKDSDRSGRAPEHRRCNSESVIQRPSLPFTGMSCAASLGRSMGLCGPREGHSYCPLLYGVTCPPSATHVRFQNPEFFSTRAVWSPHIWVQVSLKPIRCKEASRQNIVNWRSSDSTSGEKRQWNSRFLPERSCGASVWPMYLTN